MPRGGSDAGFTLLELLVATALMTVLGAVTCSLLADAKTTVDVSTEAGDLQQRARVGLEAAGSALRDAGAGPDRDTTAGPAGPLNRWAPPIWPGRTDRIPAAAAVTTIRAMAIPPATLARDAPAGTATLDFERAGGCPLPCGFVDRMTVMVLDGRGDFDLFVLVSTDGASASVRRLAGGTGASYARGEAVVPAEVRVYYWNAAAGELRTHDGDRGDFPVVNDVAAVSLEYLGEPSPPVEPRPRAGEENCLYDAAGVLRAGLPTLPRAGGTFSTLALPLFDDGPWCGGGTEPFDADLLRIRAVRLTLRVQAGNDSLRGADPRWFRSPGTATNPARFVKDLVIETTVTPRNLGGWR